MARLDLSVLPKIRAGVVVVIPSVSIVGHQHHVSSSIPVWVAMERASTFSQIPANRGVYYFSQ